MPITIACSCGNVIHAPESAAGKRGRCKACGTILLIPALGDATSDTSPESAHDVDTIAAGAANATRSHHTPPSTSPPRSLHPTATAAPSPPPLDFGTALEDDDDDESGGAAENLSPIIGTASGRPWQSSDADPVRDPTPRYVPPEPWYYKRLDQMGRFWSVLGAIIVWGGVGIGALVTAIGIARVARAPSGSGEEPLYPALMGVAIMFSSVFSGSPIYIFGLALHLAVDAARNVRAIRYTR